MDSIWPGLFLVTPPKFLRELNVHEINGSLLSCLYALESVSLISFRSCKAFTLNQSFLLNLQLRYDKTC